MPRPLNAYSKKMGTNLKFDTIVCIGNGGEVADRLAKEVADNHNILYHGFLNNDTQLNLGCYHTSIYDIKLQQLVDKLKDIVNLKIVVLDQDESFYTNNAEFYDTIDLGQVFADQVVVEFVNPSMSNPFKQIVKNNKSFCILPFTNLRWSENNLKHCCFMEPFKLKYTDFCTDPQSIQLRKEIV